MQTTGRDKVIPENYLEKVYAGVLGMNIGIRLGAPLEPGEWTVERIQRVHGEIKGYVKDYDTFSADDDANGPIFFIRALYDDAAGREMTPEDAGKAWLNYCREGIGMIWWGGEDISTEHRAFCNLKKGIPAPRSGSAELNGKVMAEQIGGQIFIDSWGLMFPGNKEEAAKYAEMAASVSHDLNGLYGARFMAACIAAAFTAKTAEDVIAAGLSVIPEDCLYAEAVHAVSEFHRRHPDDFRLCRQYLEDHWGYDKYPGICHIIPNAGVCVLALLYGGGDFARTIEIAVMCSWDTDCNAGNVGTITGVLNGLAGIPDHYRRPVNDSIVASSVSGFLNIVDLPSFSYELALLGYRMAGQEAPKELRDAVKPGDVHLDFRLPGSTHGLRTGNPFKTFLRPGNKDGRNVLEVIIDRMAEGDSSTIFYKPFYRRSSFNDEKYKPVFSPQAYSGRQASISLFLEQWQGAEVRLTPYVRRTDDGKEICLEPRLLPSGQWSEVSFTIPDTDGSVIDEVGFKLESPSIPTERAIGAVYIRRFHITGPGMYSIDFSKQCEEFLSITPFSHNKGSWKLKDHSLYYSSEDDCASFTGNYYTEDGEIEAEITPVAGFSHLLIFRAEGIQRHYLAGFDGEGNVSLICRDFGTRRLASAPFSWKHNQSYRFRLFYEGEKIILEIDGTRLIEHSDSRYKSGMIGIGCLDQGEGILSSLTMKENK